MTDAEIINICRKRGWLTVAEKHGWKIVPLSMRYPQGVWAKTLQKAYEWCLFMFEND